MVSIRALIIVLATISVVTEVVQLRGAVPLRHSY